MKHLKHHIARHLKGVVPSPTPAVFWDRFYAQAPKGLRDEHTLNPARDPLSAAYHYASTGRTWCQAVSEMKSSNPLFRFLDLGCGTGYWMDFMQRVFPHGKVEGVDVSEKAAQAASQRGFAVKVSGIHEFLYGEPGLFDLINMIGVCFHITDDGEMSDILLDAYPRVRPGGLLVISANAHWFPMSLDAGTMRRFRSRWWWVRRLRMAGFSTVRIYSVPRPRGRMKKFTYPPRRILVARKGDA